MTKNNINKNPDRNTKTAHWAIPVQSFQLKKALKIGFLFFILTILGSVSVLFIFEWKQKTTVEAEQTSNTHAPQTKKYTNSYWGFSLQFPKTWSQPTGSYADGQYFFASEPISFVNELSENEALISILCFNNWKNLEFDEWVAEQKQNIWPKTGIAQEEKVEFKNSPALRFAVNAEKEINQQHQIWMAFKKDEKTFFIFKLASNSEKNLNAYKKYFENLLQSFEYIPYDR